MNNHYAVLVKWMEDGIPASAIRVYQSKEEAERFASTAVGALGYGAIVYQYDNKTALFTEVYEL